jgi:hypothetical protein
MPPETRTGDVPAESGTSPLGAATTEVAVNEMLRSTRPFIDECGYVYVAGGGPDQQCLRLNRTASGIWRRVVGQATRSDISALQDAHREFLAVLLVRGVLTFDVLPDGAAA